MNSAAVTRILVCLAISSLFVTGCDEGTEANARPTHPQVVDPLREWSSTQHLRYIQGGEIGEMSIGTTFESMLGRECHYRSYLAEHGTSSGFDESANDTACSTLESPSDDNFCRQTYCTLTMYSCYANLTMEIAQAVGRVTWLEWLPEEERVTWLVQTTGERALAAYWGSWVLERLESFAGQFGPSDFAGATDCGMTHWPTILQQGTVLDGIGAELADQYAMLREVHEASSRYLSASADASLTGRSPNVPLSDNNSSFYLRRLAASGLVPMTIDAELRREEFCPASTGEPAVDAAIRLIRLSAIDPEVVVNRDEPNLRTFGHAVMARVVRLRGAFEPQESLENFLQREGTDLTGLLAARERLASELVVLRRSMTQLLPETLPQFDEDPEGFDTRLWAATRTEPSTYLPVANLLGALDGHDGDGQFWTEFGLPYWWGAHGGMLLDNEEWGGSDWSTSQVNIAQIVHEIGSVLVARGDATSDTELAAAFHRVGAATQRLAALDVNGTAVSGSYLFDTDEETFAGGDVTAAYRGNDLVLVTDVDAVQCATTGRVESVPCSWTDVGALEPQNISFEAYRDLDPTRPTESVDERAAYAAAHAGRQFVRWVPPPPDVDWEELRHMDPASIPHRPLFILERQTGHAARVPGGYRVWTLLYQAFERPESGEPTQTYRAAVSPALLADAASLVAPSPSDCSRPANFCAATGLDGTDRIALENELTDDGNAVENSWQRYLALARAAADQADALGERALADVQALDDRAEAAAAELENVCGVTIDPDDLADEYETSSASTLIDVLRGMPGSAAARLVRCLGGERILPYVGLGTAPVCVYHPAGRPWELCETGEEPIDGEPLPECPRVIPDGSNCSPELFGLSPELNVTTFDVPLSHMLKFFTAPTTGGGKTSTNALCAHVRAVNHNLAIGLDPNVVDAGLIRTERFFAPGNLQEFARKIRWEAEPHDHSTVYIGDTAVLSTGSPWGGRRTTLASERPNDCVLSPNALFCAQGSLSTSVSVRRTTNARLAGAATIARWMGGESYVDFVVPYHIDSNSELPNRNERTPANFRLSQDSINGYNPDAQWLVDYRGTASSKSANNYTCWDRAGYVSLPYDDVWAWRALYPGEDTWARETVDARCDQAGAGGDIQRAVVFERLAGEHVYGTGGDISDTEVDVDRRRAELFLERMLVPSGDPLSFWAQLNQIASGAVTDQRVSTACHQYNQTTGSLESANCYQQDYAGNLTLPMWIDADSHATTSDPRGVKLLANYNVPQHATLFPYVGGEDIHYRTVLDAMELLCEAGLEGGQIDFSSETEQVRTLDDVYLVERNLQRTADRYRRLGSRIIMTDMPQDVFEALSETGTAVGVAPDGQYGANLLSTRNAVVGLATLPDELATELEGMARDIRAVSDEVRRLNLGSQLNKNQFAATMSSQISRCLVASANAVSLSQAVNWGESAAVAITCADAMAQIAIAARNLALQDDIAEIDAAAALLRFEEKSSQRMVRVTSVGRRLVESTNALNAALTNLEAVRLDGRRALERMAMVGTGEGDVTYYANTNMRRRYNASHTRYERAHQRAVQAAYLARLAIEQRVGADLTSFGDDMTLVEAPVTWADSLCATVGFDAENVRDPSDPDFNDYADAYIGEYVNKLEQFMASYSNDFPFGGGSDTAVVSLRDDVNQTQAWCDVETRNLLYHTADISMPAAEPNGALGWAATNCLEDTEGDVLPNCVTATSLGGPGDAVGAGNMTSGTLQPTRLTFGLHCGEVTCGWQSGVRYSQTVSGSVVGKRRVSWYGRGSGASVAVQIRNVTSSSVISPMMVHSAPVGDESTWTHYWYDVSLVTPATIAVQIRPAAEVAGTVVDIAGLMLEEVPVGADATSEPHFTSTSGNRTLSVQACEDTDGAVFRQQSWTRHCRRVCPGGTSVSCDIGESYDECYWETQFDVSQRDIARGTLFGGAGFARGNFNYRVQSLAVNFVGTAARTCEDSSNPSTCYSGAFINYSLEHEGPYLVENYFGDSYSAPLFVGRINYARGLAAERQLTNPVVDSQIAQYTRSELRGRPLTGTYKIRVYDEAGVNFEGIEDVQLVVGYEYWTRQN